MPAEAPGPSAGLADWLRWQELLHPAAIDLGLDRVRDVAGRMHLPAKGIFTLTVAGTNGKGSTAAMLAAIYQAAGYATGAYSSPHLLHYSERVTINGVPASEAQLCAAFASVERARGGTSLTYFEFGTLAALLLFRQAGVQVQVLEVGLGGRLDAVNIVDADLAVITNIGMDHVEFLGHTRDLIAVEKAGVLRPGRPAVYVDPDPCDAILREANRLGSVLSLLNRDFSYQRAGDNWNWHGSQGGYRKLPAPALAGAIQLQNAAGVIAALAGAKKSLPVDESAIRAGLSRVRLPGRFQKIGQVILDVAHNLEAAAVLADHLAGAGVGKVHLVIGMLSDKPVLEVFRALAPWVTSVHAASIPGPRGLAAAELLERSRGAGLGGVGYADPVAALRAAQAAAAEGDTILVCGSFLTVAAVMAVLK